ncbi:TonB-dependent receptor [Flavobacterium circumlabens]|nr:TonB-dependent receptor [Flavobacterium circumlabens]
MANKKDQKKQSSLRILRQLFIAVFLLLTSIHGQSQNKVISGLVEDENKMPLPGVSILVKGTRNGAQTDYDGRFKINASTNDQLVFSSIGFETRTVVIGSSSVLNINLKEITAKLNEVIIVGYGTQKKATLTGAVSTVTSKSIENRPVTSLATALQGTVPGMNITRTSGQPGNENLNIQIRGATSANGAVNPLLLIDGVATDLFNLQTINPTDVESLSVLKDGAAAAIYGAQAAGGVILVTTKKGKEGKTTFDFSNNLAIQKPLYIPQRLSLFDEASMANLARKNAGVADEYSAADLLNIQNGVPYIENPQDPNGYTFYNQKDNNKEILRDNSIINTYNLSARGGTAKTNYLFSLGYLDQGGMFKVGEDNFKRLNVRMNIGTELNKYIYLDTKVSYAQHDTNQPSMAINGSNGLLGNLYKQRQRYPIFTPEGRLNGIGGGYISYALLSQGGYNRRTIDDIDGSFQMTIKDLAKGLKFRAIYGHKIRSEDSEVFKRTVELWGKIKPISYQNNPNSYTLDQSVLNTDNFQFLTDYNLTIAQNHKLSVLVGYQMEDYRFSSVNSGATSLKSNDLPALNLGDPTSKTNSQNIGTYASQSVFARFNYNYKERYLIEATIRTDESSRLATGLRTKTFPSISAGWNIQNEEWFSQHVNFISVLKPRISYGQLGNAQGIGYYDYLNMLTNNTNIVLGSSETKTTYFYQSTIPSSNLSWETVETFNYGLDFGFFKNKLTGSFDYYTKKNKNMLTPLRLPATLGVGTPKINNGVLESWGWELAVNYNGKIGSYFNYGVGFNLSDNQNKLTKYAGISVLGIGTNTLIEGYSLNTIWGYQTAAGYINTPEQLAAAPVYSPLTGVGDIAYVDQNGDGKINAGKGTAADHGDLVLLGKDQQQYLFGFNANASWKNIDFSMMIQGVGKRSFMPNSEMITPFAQPWISPLAIHADYWTPEHQDAAFPRPYLRGSHNYITSDRWVLNGAYARLKNIQFGYSLPKSDKLFFTKIRFYLSAENVATISKLGIFKETFDPEQKNANYADYPLFGTASLGINLIF